MSALCLCLSLEIHIFAANNRGTIRRTTCRYSHNHWKRISSWYVLFDPEQDQKIRVVAYQIFRYPRVRLTGIEAIDIRVTTHRKIFSYPACHMPRHQR